MLGLSSRQVRLPIGLTAMPLQSASGALQSLLAMKSASPAPAISGRKPLAMSARSKTLPPVRRCWFPKSNNPSRICGPRPRFFPSQKRMDCMRYRLLGRSGLKVSELCLGTMMFGGQTDAPTSERLIGKAFDAGINMLDTADQYNAGRSEEICGKAIKDKRQQWILATKVANIMGPSLNERGLSRRWMYQALEASLKRLGTDYVDIYYLHREDYNTPLETTISAIGDLIKQGKVRYFGVSNFRAWRVAEICAICDRLGIDRPIVSQPYYNAMNRMPEVEHLPACAHFGLGIIPYSPLARGVLSGKYQPGMPPPQDTRAGRNDKRIMQTEWRPESLKLAQEIRKHAEARGIT